MSVPIDQVPVWGIDSRNIGHAVSMVNHGWVHTACNITSPSLKHQKKTPKRICRACRERLKSATMKLSP